MKWLGLLLVLGATVAVVPPPARAQFPDIRQMSGTPLPSAELPDGTVSVRVVRESLANNLVGVPVTLESNGQTQSAPTDDEGRAIFSGVAGGATVQARVTVGGETVSSQSFAMPPQGGVRLILAVGIEGSGTPGAAPAPATPPAGDAGQPGAPAVPGRVVLGSQTRTIVEIIDGGLEVFHVFEIANVAMQPVDAGPPIEFALPADAQVVTLLEGSTTQARVFERKLVVAGPFAPGRTMAQVAYRLPYDGPETSFSLQLPLPMIQTNLIVRLLGETRVVAPALAQSRVAQAEGRSYWTATGEGLDQGDMLTISLAGLPYHARWPRYTALTLAGLVVAAGLWLAFRRPPDPARRLAALEARRTTLLDDLRGLDREDETRPDAAARREALLHELEGLYVLIDAERERMAPPGQPAPSR